MELKDMKKKCGLCKKDITPKIRFDYNLALEWECCCGGLLSCHFLDLKEAQELRNKLNREISKIKKVNLKQ